MSYTRYLIGSVMTVIFIVSMTIFAVNFASDNDSAITLSEDSRYTSLNSTVQAGITDSLKTDAETSQDILFKTTAESGDSSASSGAQFKIGPIGALGLAVSSFYTGFSSIFGSEFQWIAIAIVSLLTFLMGYFTYKAWFGRSPD